MKRQKIECWQCKRIFSLLIDTAGEPTLTKACPYCHAPLKLAFGGAEVPADFFVNSL